MNATRQKFHGRTIQFGVIVYWGLFWLLNSVDKFISEPTYLWVGKDRFAQLINYFDTIGIDNLVVIFGSFLMITLLEILATILFALALFHFFKKNHEEMDNYVFWGIFTGLVVFSFFSIGDQVFGDRVELLEHTTYWMALILTWGAYKYYPKLK